MSIELHKINQRIHKTHFYSAKIKRKKKAHFNELKEKHTTVMINKLKGGGLHK